MYFPLGSLSLRKLVCHHIPSTFFRYTIREEIQPDGVVSDLSIKRTERSDSAVFTCIATNSFGSDDSNINLIVQGTEIDSEDDESILVLIKCIQSKMNFLLTRYRGS